MFDDLLKKVMVVEDDIGYRRALVNALFHEYTVIEAEDGEQAVEKLLAHRPDVIILDLLLPKLDGFEVLSRIRSYPDQQIAKTPVIVLSNLSNNQDTLKAHNLSVDAYFVKANTKLEEVLQKISQIAYFGTPAAA